MNCGKILSHVCWITLCVQRSMEPAKLLSMTAGLFYCSLHNLGVSSFPHTPSSTCLPTVSVMERRKKQSLCNCWPTPSAHGQGRPGTWAATCLQSRTLLGSPLLHWQEARVKSWAWVSDQGTMVWDPGVLIGDFPTRPSSCHICPLLAAMQWA